MNTYDKQEIRTKMARDQKVRIGRLNKNQNFILTSIHSIRLKVRKRLFRQI